MENFNTNDLISIIVPMYNVQRYLAECVKSIEQQSYRNLEILLIDDGSTDSTLNIAEQLAKSFDNIKVYGQINQGQGSARNLGLDNIHGDYVMFIDSDDFIKPEMCKVLLEKMKKNTLDIIECSYCEKFCASNQKEYIYHTDVPCDIVLSGIEFYKNPTLSPCNKLYKKEYLDNIGFRFTENHFAEDVYDISNVILHTKRIMRIDKVLYYYRRDNLSSTRNNKNPKHKIKLGVDKLFIAKKLNGLKIELGLNGQISNIIVRNIFGAIFSPSMLKVKGYSKRIGINYREYKMSKILYENLSLKILFELFKVGVNRIFFHKD